MSASQATRDRLLAATLTCVERWGLAKTGLEDVAREAGLSRATVYRYFPEGRRQLVSETVTWEVGRFFALLEEEVDAEPDLTAKLVRGLMFGYGAIQEHALLQQLLRVEPGEILEELSASTPLVGDAISAYLLGQLGREHLRAGVDPAEAADYLTRLFLSYLGSQGQWDLTDRTAVDHLVRTQLLAGILAP